jgi:predicted RNA-binding protein with PIN domain/aminoglycoside phosphotransferase (APT) family kinase protein
VQPLWIVDASNVVGARPDGWWRDRAAGIARLVDEIVRWREATGEEVLVVIDGHPSHRVPEGSFYGVDVRYAHSSRRDAADDEIVRTVARLRAPAGATVVTSDRRLREQVAELGAVAEGARSFLARIADIEPRRRDRAVLAAFGIGESALLGRGGEARVFALDGERVLRLPHASVDALALEGRRRLLAAIGAAAWVVAVPEVLEHREVDGRPVVVERRLPGRNALDVLGERGTDREALVRDHLAVAGAIADLPCPSDRFGEVLGDRRLATAGFADWAEARLAASLAVAGDAFARVDPAALTRDLLAALPEPESARPRLVHLDAFLGNMLAVNDRISALLDFGPMTIGGPRDLDPLVAIAYLAPEITPTANDSDRRVAGAWADEAGLAAALGPVARWIAAYWTGAPDDERLRRWCERVLLGRSPGSR